MDNNRLKLIVFSVFVVGLSVLTFFVFRPFLGILVLAAVLSVLFHPLFEKLIKIFPRKRSFVAGLLVTVALIFVIIPILFFGLQIFAQAQDFFAMTLAGQGQYTHAMQENVNIFVQRFVPSFSFDIGDSVSKILTFISANFAGLLSQTIYVFLLTFFLLFTFFFSLRDGEKMLDSFISLSPFEKKQNEEIVDSVYRTITTVIRGTLFVGLIRFIVIAAGFYFFGIPNALLWGSIGGIIGVVPGLGTPFAIIPAVIYFLLSGNIILAIFMALFGFLIFFFIDNMLSAYFFDKGLDVPPFIILFSILGGIIFFGPLGFIFGPIILSLFISVIDMYKILVLKKSEI